MSIDFGQEGAQEETVSRKTVVTVDIWLVAVLTAALALLKVCSAPAVADLPWTVVLSPVLLAVALIPLSVLFVALFESLRNAVEDVRHSYRSFRKSNRKSNSKG